MDLRQLNYFVAVAETGHVGRAARRLHLSQPPLSRQIKALEDEIGAALFERTAWGMALTEPGKELLRHARSVLGLVAQAAEDTRRVARGERGRLDVGVYGSAVFGVVPRILAAFRRNCPRVDVALHHAQTPQQIDALRQGRVLVVFERLLPEERDIQVVHVARETLLLAMADDHPLAASAAVPVEALANETLLVGSAPAAASAALDLCRAHGFEPRFAAPASDVVTATLLASLGGGVTLVPESMTHVRYPSVTYRPLVSRVPAFMDLHCFFLKGSTSPLLAELLDTIAQSASLPPAGA